VSDIIKKEEKKPDQIKKTITGVVVSDKMDKTVVVQIEYKKMHKLYKKFVKKSKKFKAHDEKNECKTGDTVKIIECRPLSKEKKWKIIEIVSRAK
jgi:small subunit ribosomal protein S17